MRCYQMFRAVSYALFVLGLVTYVGQADVIRWDFNADGVMPDAEVPGTDRFELNAPAGAESVASGLWRLNTGPANSAYLRYAWDGMTLTNYADVWTRMKVEGASSHNNLVGYGFSFDENYRALLAIDSSGVALSNTAAVSTPTTDGYHTYRMVYNGSVPSGQRVKLYQDGNLLIQANAESKASSLDLFYFGDATNSGTADWSVDWVHAYTDPDNAYEHYWLPDALPEDSNPAWALRDNPPDVGDNRTLVPGQYLRIDTPATGGNGSHDDAYCDFEILDQIALADFTRPSTVDFTMRVISQSEGSYVNGLTVYVPEGSDTRYYAIKLDDTRVGLANNYQNLDTSLWHDYRLSIDPTTHLGSLYVDGSATALLTSTGTTISSFYRNGLFWGDGANGNAGIADWSFVGWTNRGAFAGDEPLLVIPEPSTICLGLLGAGLLVLATRRRRRGSAP